MRFPRALGPTLWRFVRLTIAADPPRAIAYLLIALLLGLLPIATALAAKFVLDRLSAALLRHGDRAMADAAFLAAAWYVALRFVARLLEPAGRQLEGNLITRTTARVERRLLEVGGAIPDLDHFERAAFHDEIAFLQGEISWRPKALISDLHDLIQSPLTLVGSLVLLWRFQPLLPLVLLLATIPLVRVEGRLRLRTYTSMAERSAAARMMAYCLEVTTEPGAAKETLVYGLGPWFRARWRRLAGEALAEMERHRRQGMTAITAVIGGNGVALAAGYAYIAAQVGSHHLTVGDFALYLSVVTGLQQTLTALTFALTGGYDNARFMRRLFDFLASTRPSIAVAPPGAGVPAPERVRQAIELRHVGFTYPGLAHPVLRDVSCTLRAGETVAIVGQNGAGKTTLVKLLARLYDPTTGEILLDGLPIAAYDLAGLRRRIATMSQDFARFVLTAQQNIGVGDVRHVDDQERTLAAARWSGADAVLAKLPQGPYTLLSTAFEGGVDLSGGEWQKVAMARAAMRDAALVILDEPTAALDAQAEHDLFTRFRDLAAGRTVLLISHRFSTVRMADRILVLEDGRIIEAGTHDELVALGGRYAALYEMQAGRYR